MAEDQLDKSSVGLIELVVYPGTFEYTGMQAASTSEMPCTKAKAKAAK